MNMGSLIDSVAVRLQQEAKPGDYEQDGLLYCGACHTPKQCRITVCGSIKIVGCLCACQSEVYNEQVRKEREAERRMYIDGLRVQGIQDRSLRDKTFANADTSIQTSNISRCRNYVDNFSKMLESNNGLLFWGNTETGKTHAAACIANALIDKGIPVMVTSFPRILNSGFDERADIIRQMKEFDLLVIDDLGTERQSEFAMETVYMVIDERYKTQKPLIVTTNLTWKEIQKPKNMDYARIYSRITEMCVPVFFGGEGIRQKKAVDKLRFAKEILGGSHEC